MASIISRQLYTQRQQENLRSNKKARANSASCIQDQTVEHKQYIGERACPFTRIAFEAKHDVLYTRKCFYKFEPSVQWDGGLIQGLDALHDYYTRVSRTMNSECAGISTDTRQSMRDYLPLLIYLGRSERYSFVFYLYLDSDIQEGGSSKCSAVLPTSTWCSVLFLTCRCYCLKNKKCLAVFVVCNVSLRV